MKFETRGVKTAEAGIEPFPTLNEPVDVEDPKSGRQ
jgi:hypothetical protein